MWSLVVSCSQRISDDLATTTRRLAWDVINANQRACEDADDAGCAEVASICPIAGFVAVFADVDFDADGLNDGVSAGYVIETQPVDVIAPQKTFA